MPEPTDLITLLAGADVGPVVEPTDQFAELILPTLRTADLRFAQCERTYSTRGFSSDRGNHKRLHPRLASIWKVAGIDVASLASNHSRDWGPEALEDTIDLFREMGIATIGAGRDIEEARRPAILDYNGVKVAFLGYVSVVRPGEHAGPGRTGPAPLRARTYYEPADWQPGCPPRVISEAYEEDVQALEDDIRAAKRQADVVIVSLHWGVHMLPKVIATYQPPVAHAAIDAGADLILGHHAHLLKAVEVYKGKVCFYSMGNFMTTGGNEPGSPSYQDIHWHEMAPEDQPPQGMYPFPKDSKKTILVKAVMSNNGVERVSFLPTWINSRAQPAVLTSDDSRFAEVTDYVEWVSDQFPHTFRIEGDEVVVEA